MKFKVTIDQHLASNNLNKPLCPYCNQADGAALSVALSVCTRNRRSRLHPRSREESEARAPLPRARLPVGLTSRKALTRSSKRTSRRLERGSFPPSSPASGRGLVSSAPSAKPPSRPSAKPTRRLPPLPPLRPAAGTADGTSSKWRSTSTSATPLAWRPSSWMTPPSRPLAWMRAAHRSRLSCRDGGTRSSREAPRS